MMAFPDDALDVRVELKLGGGWTDITEDVYADAGITITRGRADEATRTDPGSCTFTLNNAGGKYSPRNPRSAYFGTLKRNTPVRVWLAPTSLRVIGDGSYAASTATTALNVTEDLDLSVDVTPLSWRPPKPMVLAGRYDWASNNRSWLLRLSPDGTLHLVWSADGTFNDPEQRQSTAAMPNDRVRRAVRVTVDTNDAGNNTTTFYYADTLNGPWTQLGDPVTAAGISTIFDGTAVMALGADSLGDVGINGSMTFAGRIHAAELRDGIAGAVLTDPDFSAVSAHSITLTDASAITWELKKTAEIIGSVRFSGEVAAWPQRWDITEQDVCVPVQAAGILRRLGQGASALRSPLFRSVMSAANLPAAYWPCEDGQDAAALASALPGAPPMDIIGSPSLAADSGFAASEPLPTMQSGSFSGVVPAYTPTDKTQIRFLLAVPTGGLATDQQLINVSTTGTAPRWQVVYLTSGALHVRVLDSSGVTLVDEGAAFAVHGKRLRVHLELTQTGNDVDWVLATLEPGDDTALTWQGTLTNRTVGRVTEILVGAQKGLGDTVMGHFSVHPTITTVFDSGQALGGYVGERAGRRIQRLCAEEGIPLRPFTINDAYDDTATLAPQRADTLLNLLFEAAEVDHGLLFETRDDLGLMYRPGRLLYNQGD